MRQSPPANIGPSSSAGHAAAQVHALFQQAVQAFQERQLQASQQLLQRLLTLQPKHFDALHLMGAIAGSRDDPLEAIDWFRQAIAVNSKSAVAHSNLGGALNEAGQFETALKSCERALKLRPDYAEAHNNRGNALRALDRLDAALASYDRAIAIKPDFAAAHNNRGNALRGLRRLDAAVASYDRAIAIEPDFAAAYNNRGNALAELKQLEAAVLSYDRAIELDPDYAEAHANRGAALVELRQFEAALASCDRAVELDPDHAEAHANRGAALLELKRFESALASLDRAIELEPDYAEAHCSRGMALAARGQLEAAMASCDRAIGLKPDFAEAYNSRGNVLTQLGQLDAAVASYDRAIQLQPDYADPYFNKSIILLQRGDFANGWKPYEWRWLVEKFRARSGSASRHFAADWDGKACEGSLLVLPEQGIGDQIFYSGMLKDLQSHAASITVCLDKRLVSLYRRSFENIEFEAVDDLGSERTFDFQVYLPSLGRLYRAAASDFRSVKVPYLFADDGQTQSLRSRLRDGAKLVCGLSWISKNRELGEDKSLSLDRLQPILRQAHIDFVDLQYGDTSAEQSAFLARTGIRLRRIPEIDNFENIDGLAALIAACDVVLTVSNTTAHLAAALGKPVFVLLPRSSRWGLLWYWHVDRSDSPWYPTAKLYRQDRTGDWDDAFRSFERDLAQFCVARR